VPQWNATPTTEPDRDDGTAAYRCRRARPARQPVWAGGFPKSAPAWPTGQTQIYAEELCQDASLREVLVLPGDG